MTDAQNVDNRKFTAAHLTVISQFNSISVLESEL